MPSALPLRSAEIIAVGSELLGTVRLDTNSLYLTEQLACLGIEIRTKHIVGDHRETLARVFENARDRADLIVFTGGLGPTDDDLTREVVAGVLGRTLDIDEAIVERIRARFARRGMAMPDVNRRQAQVPRGATVLENPNGTAPGLLLEDEQRLVVLLPGPPRELIPMFAALCERVLAARAGAERLYTASLFVTGRSESDVEQRVQPIYSTWRDAEPRIETTILAVMGQIELHLSTRGADPASARARIDAARDELARVLGDDVYSTDGRSMPEIVGERLRVRGYAIAAAESCTGGLLLSRMTDVPGSSDYVYGGVVAYENEAKVAWLDVPEALIAQHGAVSEPVAVAMAEGIRAKTGAQVAVAITGIAGPGGGTVEKPVGTVAYAVLVPDQPAYVRTHVFLGGRDMVKFQSTQAVLDRVRRLLR
ncbi:MAG: competence/damage-inducible protein A [Acidobacteria bacterium]|nr:competence/damage-inducible protein A [Acidobacteriota bacterium]